MKVPLQRGAQLPFRVDPVAGESPRGYLCRVAHAYAYDGPLSLAHIAGLSISRLESGQGSARISHVLRLEPEEWRGMCYRHVQGPNRFQQRMFRGERISADDLNYRRPRICSACLEEQPIWWAVWDLGLVTTCPIHRCLLVNRCPACQRPLGWRRPTVYECRCSFDLRNSSTEGAAQDLVAVNAAIYRAARVSSGDAAVTCGFPSEMLKLRLGSLLRLILFVGSIQEDGRLRRKQRPFSATDLLAATEIDRAAVTVLTAWPHHLREVLKSALPPETTDPTALNFSEIFGNFCRHLFHVLPRAEFGFLHDAFERFVIEDWKGLIRGQHRYFSAAVRRSSHWVTANVAERIARTGGEKILELVRQGQIESVLVSVRRGGGHTEYWIRWESLNRWIADRDAELARYMLRHEAKDTLGLTNTTIVNVAAAGAIRYVKGPDRNFPVGFFLFLREDVLKIKHAFERHAVSVKKYTQPGKLIALRHAMKNYFGRDAGLAAVIRAVVDGGLAPSGYTKQFPGITGYLFQSEHLHKYRPVPGAEVPPTGFLNYKEAAILGVEVRVIQALVAQGILGAPLPSRNGFPKLVVTDDIRRFAEEYVASTVIAKQYKLNGRSFARHLRESGAALLTVPLPERGRYEALFLPKISRRVEPARAKQALGAPVYSTPSASPQRAPERNGPILLDLAGSSMTRTRLAHPGPAALEWFGVSPPMMHTNTLRRLSSGILKIVLATSPIGEIEIDARKSVGQSRSPG